MSVPTELLYAALTGISSGVVTGAVILVAVRQDVKWLKAVITELRGSIRDAHRRIDAIQQGRDRDG